MAYVFLSFVFYHAQLMPVIPVSGRVRQADNHGFRANLNTVSSRTAQDVLDLERLFMIDRDRVGFFFKSKNYKNTKKYQEKVHKIVISYYSQVNLLAKIVRFFITISL